MTPHALFNKVVYVVLNNEIDRSEVDKDVLKGAMKNSVKAHLNPLFGISDIVITEALPRTASNKIVRRNLRDQYLNTTHTKYIPPSNNC